MDTGRESYAWCIVNWIAKVLTNAGMNILQTGFSQTIDTKGSAKAGGNSPYSELELKPSANGWTKNWKLMIENQKYESLISNTLQKR